MRQLRKAEVVFLGTTRMWSGQVERNTTALCYQLFSSDLRVVKGDKAWRCTQKHKKNRNFSVHRTSQNQWVSLCDLLAKDCL